MAHGTTTGDRTVRGAAVPAPAAGDAGTVPAAAGRLDRVVPALLLAGYAVLLGVAVLRHEPWFDEAQAWLLARDAALPELFTQLLRYEGTPGLWHALLLAPSRLGLPYAALQVVAAGAALAGAALLALAAPFPRWVRAGLLASFPLAYQYAVVARSYVLIPPLLFGLAALHDRRHRLAGPYALLLALLAWTSVHGLLVAGAIGAVWAWDTRGAWPDLDAGARRAHLVAATALSAAAVVILALLWPPADAIPGTGTRAQGLAGAVDALAFLDLALAGVPWVTATAVVVTGALFARTRTLVLWALPTLALLTFSAVRYHAPHHDALPFLIWVYALWVAWGRTHAGDRLRAAALAVLVPVLVVNVVGGVRAWRADLDGPYSGSRALAAHLATLDDDVVVHGYDPRIVGALPYLVGNPYANLRGGRLPGYWSHTPGGLPHAMERERVARDRPDVVVWAVHDAAQPPELPGYRPVRRFAGTLTGRDGPVRDDDFVVYERSTS